MSNIAFIPYNFPFNVSPTPNGIMVLLGGITSSSAYSNAVDKYDYTANTMTTGALLLNSRGGNSRAASNKVFAVVAGDVTPGPSAATDKYYFAVDIVESGATLQTSTWVGCYVCYGSADEAIFMYNPVNRVHRNRYQYASDTNLYTATGSSNRSTTWGASGPGVGLAVGGSSSSASTEFYDFSSHTRSAGPVTPATMSGQGTGLSNTSVAIFTRATTNKVTYKYDWATGAWTTAGSLSLARNLPGGGSTATIGVVFGGTSTGGGTSDVYNFATDVVTTGASLINPKRDMGVACDAPGNL